MPNITHLESISDSRYIGAVCLRHPALKGLRRKVGYKCVACVQEAKQRYRRKYADRIAIHKKDAREKDAVAHEIRKRITHEIRVKAAMMASKELKDPTKWKLYWTEAKEEYEREHAS